MIRRSETVLRRITPSQIAERLKVFEVKYGMTTTEFLVGWRTGEMADPETGLEPWEFIEWAMNARLLEQTKKEDQ